MSAPFLKLGGEGVPEDVRGHLLWDSCLFGVVSDQDLDRLHGERRQR